MSMDCSLTSVVTLCNGTSFITIFVIFSFVRAMILAMRQFKSMLQKIKQYLAGSAFPTKHRKMIFSLHLLLNACYPFVLTLWAIVYGMFI